jgi:anaerobic magnesium-protoporphyrin IX monomethyl ester cyclase
MSRILFVNPFFLSESQLEQRLMTLYFPLGLLYLASVAREAGHRVDVFDGTFQERGDFPEQLARLRPEVVCVASWITVRRQATRLAEVAKARGATVIVGGPDPTRNPDRYLEQDAFDLLVLGEAEETLLEVLTALERERELAEVPGIACRNAQGRSIRTPARPAIMDLDRLPWPARDLIDVERYLRTWEHNHGYRSLTLAASRGCPDPGCQFCNDALLGAHLRLRSPENVVEEMADLQARFPLDRFRLVDDLEALPADWLQRLSARMLRMGVHVPFEDLKKTEIEGVRLLQPVTDICADRNAWIPRQADHMHAPPVEDSDLLARRWERAELKAGEHLEDP